LFGLFVAEQRIHLGQEPLPVGPPSQPVENSALLQWLQGQQEIRDVCMLISVSLSLIVCFNSDAGPSPFARPTSPTLLILR
jgi:hypothetical protein